MGLQDRDGGDDRPDADGFPPRRRAVFAVAGLVAALGAAGGAAAVTRSRVPPTTSLTVSGLADGAALGIRQLASAGLTVSSVGPGFDQMTVTIDDATSALPAPLGQATIPLDNLAEGSHTITISMPGVKGAPTRTETRTVTVDLAPPTVTGPPEISPRADGKPVTIAGLVDDGVSATINGQPLALVNGSYRLAVDASASAYDIAVSDAAGNETHHVVQVTATPTLAAYPATSAVHVGQSAWADDVRREGVLQIIREGRINAVELDIKDEVGDLGYPSTVPLATTIGAKMGFYDVKVALDLLHSMKVRVIGRVVCFLDPTLAKWSWANSHPNDVILDSAGTAPLLSQSYGNAAFTNLASPTVQQYNIDLAAEAAKLGFDEIIFDYVRRPEGDITRMKIPDLVGPPEVELARFVRRAAAALAPTGTKLGLSLFGIAATRPADIAQDVALLGPLVDYVAPMVYPSLWGDGEYGVPKPWKDPYAIVSRSLVDWQAVAAGTGAAVVPWIEDFPAGRAEYNEFQVAAQIQAAGDLGLTGFLVWNPKTLYHSGGINPIGVPPVASPVGDTSASTVPGAASPELTPTTVVPPA